MDSESDNLIRHTLEAEAERVQLTVDSEKIRTRIDERRLPSRNVLGSLALVGVVAAALVVSIQLRPLNGPRVGGGPPVASEVSGATPSPTWPATPTPSQSDTTPPSGCGTYSTYDYLGSLGSDPYAAMNRFVEGIQENAPSEPGETERWEALLNAAITAVPDGDPQIPRRFVARDDAGMLGIFTIAGWPDGGYVVDSSWIRYPDLTC
jgi:hypothetical protein